MFNPVVGKTARPGDSGRETCRSAVAPFKGSDRTAIFMLMSLHPKTGSDVESKPLHFLAFPMFDEHPLTDDR